MYNNSMNRKKKIIIAIVSILILAFFIGAFCFLNKWREEKNKKENKVETIINGKEVLKSLEKNEEENKNQSELLDSNENVDRKEKGRTYPITDGKTFRIISGRKYVCEETFWAEWHYQEILEIKTDQGWKEVYSIKDLGDNMCGSSSVIGEDSIKISPLKDYVEFSIYGWEWSADNLVNIKTKKQVLALDTYPREIIWSKNARNYAFISYMEELGGTGRDAVWVSEFNNPDKPKIIFNLIKWSGGDKEAFLKYRIDGVHFIDNKVIEFSVFSGSHNLNDIGFEIVRFQYDIERNKLVKTFQK